MAQGRTIPIPDDRLAHRAYRLFRLPVLLFFIILLAGAAGYAVVSDGKASLVDCVYMTFITVATIGYAKVIDLSHSPGGRVFTMIIALAGIANFAYMTSKLTAFIVEGNINEVLRRRKMQDRINALRGHCIVCGIGRVGSNIAHELIVTQRSFVGIDESHEAIGVFSEKFPDRYILHGDWLNRAGIEYAAGIFAVTGDDSKNLLITLTAKQLNPSARIVARCHDVRNMDKLTRVGADDIVSPDFTGGMRMAASMIRPTVVSFLDEMLRSDNSLRVEEVPVPEDFKACRLAEVAPRSRDYIVLAVHDEGAWRFNPDADLTIKAGNTLVIISQPEGRHELERRVAA